MSKLTLLEKAENYVSNLFLESNTSGLFYHNFNHTLHVVETTKNMVDALNLSTEASECLILSAWFHDTGYLYTRHEHEAKSIEIVINALRPNYTALTAPVVTCIAATKVGEIPKNDLAALLKDADIAFGSAYDFRFTNNAYREELRVLENRTFTDDVWKQMSIDFLKSVQFFSEYGKTYFAPLVKHNLEDYIK